MKTNNSLAVHRCPSIKLFLKQRIVFNAVKIIKKLQEREYGLIKAFKIPNLWTNCVCKITRSCDNQSDDFTPLFSPLWKVCFQFFLLAEQAFIDIIEAPLKTSLGRWVPLINYYSVLSLLFLSRKYFLRALVLKLKFGEISIYYFYEKR